MTPPVHPAFSRRRSDKEPHSAGGFDDSIKRYYDHNIEMTVVKLITGDCYVATRPREMLVTILGSCVSVCARDPIAGVGGMNHFLLPGNQEAIRRGEVDYTTRFGAFAMEELINGILKAGGVKSRLEIKIFGGGNVINNSALIGSKNIAFVKKYLKDEGFRVASEHVGGELPRRIHYYPDTGKVMMRLLKRQEDKEIVKEELEFEHELEKQDKEMDVELFD